MINVNNIFMTDAALAALGADGAREVAHRCLQQRQVRGTEEDGDHSLMLFRTEVVDIVVVIDPKENVYLRLRTECSPWTDACLSNELGPYPNSPENN
jgi:hypothetical protein